MPNTPHSSRSLVISISVNCLVLVCGLGDYAAMITEDSDSFRVIRVYFVSSSPAGYHDAHASLPVRFADARLLARVCSQRCTRGALGITNISPLLHLLPRQRR